MEDGSDVLDAFGVHVISFGFELVLRKSCLKGVGPKLMVGREQSESMVG